MLTCTVCCRRVIRSTRDTDCCQNGITDSECWGVYLELLDLMLHDSLTFSACFIKCHCTYLNLFDPSNAISCSGLKTNFNREAYLFWISLFTWIVSHLLWMRPVLLDTFERDEVTFRWMFIVNAALGHNGRIYFSRTFHCTFWRYYICNITFWSECIIFIYLVHFVLVLVKKILLKYANLERKCLNTTNIIIIIKRN